MISKTSLIGWISSYWITIIGYLVYSICSIGFIGGMVILVQHVLPDTDHPVNRGGLPYVDPFRFVKPENMTQEWRDIQAFLRPLIKIQQIGYYIHVVPGCLYFLSGIVQYSFWIRQRFPTFHRGTGYFYLAMQIISTIGLLIISYGGWKPEGGLMVQSIVPFAVWYWFWTAYRFLDYAVKRDIIEHQIWVTRNLAFAFAIIMVRPWVMVFNVTMKLTQHDTLGAGVTVFWLIAILLSELYIWQRWDKGIFATKSVQTVETSVTIKSNGTATNQAIHTQVSLPTAIPGPWIPVTVTACKILDDRTYILQLQVEKGTPFIVAPGEHVSINCNGVSRSYTPITKIQDSLSGKIDLLIRKVPKGNLSNFLLHLEPGSKVKLYGSVSSGLILPTIQRLEREKMIFIALGSGITPFFSLLQQIAANKSPQSADIQLSLIYFHGCGGEKDIPLKENLDELVKVLPGLELKYEAQRPREPSLMAKLKFDDASPKGNGNFNDWCTGFRAKIFICGPPGAEILIRSWCLKNGFHKSDLWCFSLNNR